MGNRGSTQEGGSTKKNDYDSPKTAPNNLKKIQSKL
jgi:hypothetical protein